MKCNKVKNPCKICFQSVSKKNGLQCQGACQKWAHFKCLNYTPGKIQDIKAGVIKITCPCPDCNTEEPKEVLTDPPFTCTNTQCPANKLPVCDSIDCPSKDKASSPPSPCPTPPIPPKSQCPPPRTTCTPPRPTCPPPKSVPISPCPPPKTPPCPPPKPPCVSPPIYDSPKSSPPPPPCPPKKARSPGPPVCPPTCPSYPKAKNTKKSFSPKLSQSCSEVSNESSASGRQVDRMRSISSDSKLSSAGGDPKILFAAIESLCNTVGQLSNQLRNLMCKMQSNYG